MKFGDTLTASIKMDLEIGVVPALMGDPGIGKSSCIEDIAYAMGSRCFTVQCNLLSDKADLTGARLMPYTKADGTDGFMQAFFPHEDIQDAIDYAIAHPNEYPILFLDEINRTTSDVTSGTLGISTARKIGREKLPANLRLAVAGNLKGNVTSLDEASLSRFSIYNVEPDAQSLMNIMGDKMNPWIRKVLTQFPDMIFQRPIINTAFVDGDDEDASTMSLQDLEDTEGMNQITTPRTIEYLSKWLNKMDRQTLATYLATPATTANGDTTLLNELVIAKVGDTPFALQVVSTISEDLAANATGSTSGITVPLPNCYASLKAATTVSDLDQIISTLSDNDKGASILYALTESEDNSRLLQQLAFATNAMSGDHNRTLMQLLSNSQLNSQNVDALQNTNAPLANALGQMFSLFQ